MVNFVAVEVPSALAKVICLVDLPVFGKYLSSRYTIDEGIVEPINGTGIEVSESILYGRNTTHRNIFDSQIRSKETIGVSKCCDSAWLGDDDRLGIERGAIGCALSIEAVIDLCFGSRGS